MNIRRLLNQKRVAVLYTGIFIFSVMVSSGHTEEARFIKESFPDSFTLKEPVNFYDPGNLFEYIDGQAVYYLSYGFTKLEHGFYQKGNATFYVDVYELNSRLSAFGAFRQQRESSAADIKIGCEGAITDYLTVFYKGNFYVEIIPMTSGDDDVGSMKLLAGHVVKLIPGAVEFPPEVGLFPQKGLIRGSERYVDENLLSYSFMGKGLVAQYLIEGEEKEIRVFISLTDNEKMAQDILKEYYGKLQSPSSIKIGDLTGFTGKEPYRGTTMLASWKQLVFGCIGVENEMKSIDLLNAVHLNLEKL